MGENNQEEGNTKSRKVWVAIGLSILAPGLGHIYCGHLIRGIIFLLFLAIVGLGKDVILLYAMNQPQSTAHVFYVILLLLFSFYVLTIVDAILVVRKNGDKYEAKRYNRWYIYFAFFAIAFFVIRPLRIHGFIIQAYVMPTESMAPTIVEGNRFLVDVANYSTAKIQRGDIVSFEQPVEPKIMHIKRIVGLPGETIEIKDRQVYINGHILQETYVVHQDLGHPSGMLDNLSAMQIPRGHYFLMGDNRYNSADSRLYGPVEQNSIEGKVKVIYGQGGQVVWRLIENPVYK